MSEKIIHQIRNAEASDMADLIIRLFKESTLVENAYLLKLFTPLETLQQDLQRAVKIMKAQSEMEDLDADRDDKARALFFVVQGALYNPDDTIKKAAQSLYKILNHYSMTMLKESYAVESTQIYSLLNDLQTADLQEAIATIQGVGELIDDLQASQEVFQATAVAFEEQKSVEANYDSATLLKRKVVDYINRKIIVFLDGILIVDKDTYGTLAREIFQLVGDRNIIIRRRRSRGGNQEKGNEEE